MFRRQIVMAGDDPVAQRYAERIAPVRKDGNLLLCTLLLGNVAVSAPQTALSAVRRALVRIPSLARSSRQPCDSVHSSLLAALAPLVADFLTWRVFCGRSEHVLGMRGFDPRSYAIAAHGDDSNSV